MARPGAHRKFYDLAERESGEGEGEKTKEHSRPEQLVKYVATNIIGADTVFSSPFGPRKVVYCDYTASGRSLSFIEDYIRKEVLPQYGSTHTTSSVTALQTTLFRHEARDIIRNATQASEHDRVLFVGSGATAALHKLIHGLALSQAPVVVVGPYAHHSSLLPWREIGAKVIRIRETADGGIDTQHLEDTLIQHQGEQRQMIGCFAAASNVTGVVVDDVRVTMLLHQYGALALWDYASAAPYVPLRMNPIVAGDVQGHAHKDAMFFSMHKFLGGVQTPGVLVAKKGLFKSEVPEVCGGGSVFFVSRDSHRYLKDVETREEGGTPAIVEAVRAGLVMQLTTALTPALITTRTAHLARVLEELVSSVEELEALGPLGNPGQLPILSFVVRHPLSGLLLHHNFVCAVLNDLFGVQARGGCACAGPYAQDLLGLPEPLAQRYEALLLEDPRLDRSHLRRRLEHSDLEVLRPGFVRLNLPYTADQEQVEFVVTAVREVCMNAWRLLPQYSLNPETGEWKHHTNLVFRGRQWLQNTSYSSGTFTYPPSNTPDQAPDFNQCLQQAKEVFQQAAKASQRRHIPDDTILFQGEASSLRWFLLPSEAKTLLLGGHSSSSPFPKPPFTPVHYPLTTLELHSRPDHVWDASGETTALKLVGMLGTSQRQNDNSNSAETTYSMQKTGKPTEMNVNPIAGIKKLEKANVRTGMETRDGIGVAGGSEVTGLKPPAVSGDSVIDSGVESCKCPGANFSLVNATNSHQDRREGIVERQDTPETGSTGLDSDTKKKENQEAESGDTDYDRKKKEKKCDDSDKDKTKKEEKNDDDNDGTKNGEISDADNDSKKREKKIADANSDRTKKEEKSDDADNDRTKKGEKNYNSNNDKKEKRGKMVCEDLKCFIKRADKGVHEEVPVPEGAKWHSPPKNLFNPTLEALTEFGMIMDGDRVMVCLSGGKDSLSLLHVLRQYQFYAAGAKGVTFTLAAATVDPMSAAYDPRPLIPYLASLGVPYYYEQQDILGQAAEQKDLNSICSFCSRMKRGRLYAAARRNSCNVLAFGQHLDDLAESFMMSVFHNGRLRTMKANYTVREGDLRVIRPFVYVREKDLRSFAESRKLPVIPENCPACFEAPKERQRVKQVLAQQEVLFPGLYWSLRSALHPVMAISLTGVESAVFGRNGVLPTAATTTGKPHHHHQEEEEEEELET